MFRLFFLQKFSRAKITVFGCKAFSELIRAYLGSIDAQWASTASADYSLALLLQAMILLSTGGGNGGGYYASKYVLIGFHAGILVIHALVNSLSITLLGFLGKVASVWNVVGMSLPGNPKVDEVLKMFVIVLYLLYDSLSRRKMCGFFL